MAKDYNICEFCGKEGADKVYFDSCHPVAWCGCKEGRQEMQAAEEERAERAREDHYERY